MLLLAPGGWQSSELPFPLTHTRSELSFADDVSLYWEAPSVFYCLAKR